MTVKYFCNACGVEIGNFRHNYTAGEHFNTYKFENGVVVMVSFEMKVVFQNWLDTIDPETKILMDNPERLTREKFSCLADSEGQLCYKCASEVLRNY